jgi:hypothetical protein
MHAENVGDNEEAIVKTIQQLKVSVCASQRVVSTLLYLKDLYLKSMPFCH